MSGVYACSKAATKSQNKNLSRLLNMVVLPTGGSEVQNTYWRYLLRRYQHMCPSLCSNFIDMFCWPLSEIRWWARRTFDLRQYNSLTWVWPVPGQPDLSISFLSPLKHFPFNTGVMTFSLILRASDCTHLCVILVNQTVIKKSCSCPHILCSKSSLPIVA